MRRKIYTLKNRKVIFSKGPMHLVDCDVQMPDGRVLSRQILEHPGAVVILPEIKKRRYLLVRQFRFATGTSLWEFPAGGIELKESIPTAVKRELMEEVGYRPQKIKKLVAFYPTPGISGEIMYLYLAQKLVPAKAVGDEDEEIEVKEFSLSQIGRMIKKKQIVDGKTIIGYFYLKYGL